MYSRSFKWLGQLCPNKSVIVPRRRHLHVSFNETSESDRSHCYCEKLHLFLMVLRRNCVVYHRFNFFLPQPTLLVCSPSIAGDLSLPVMSTRWCCWSVIYNHGRATVHAQRQLVWRQQRENTAHIIITISANCGEGSITVSVDMLHIVSIILKMLFHTMP